METEEKARRLQQLYEAIRKDANYRSSDMGTVFVPGRGSFEGRPVVFIGEAPGKDEERQEAPFVGAAGRNLNELLRDIGVQREAVFVTNLVKYRPFTSTGDNRNPTPEESRRALPYLIEELLILTPRLVVCLGLSSAKALLNDRNLKMGQANGTVFTGHGLQILVTYHPSPYNYRIPEKREAMAEAFAKLGKILWEPQ